MTKITSKYRSALNKMLNGMSKTMPKGMLTFGKSSVSGDTFCRVISTEKAITRLLSCTDLEIKGVAFFYDVQAAFVAFLKKMDVNAHYYILITHTELANYRSAAF